jgi:hypothetical protein
MKSRITCFCLLLTAIFAKNSFAANGDTILVNTFSNAIHQNCNTIVQTFNFPADTNHYEKIMLHYKLACPAGIGCDPYDRIGVLKAFKKTGVFDSTLTEILEPFEIMRMITPYGMGVNLWVDVSDYRSLLNDSVKMSTIICGYANGWSVTADFYMIKGRPIREAYKIDNLWNGTFQYGNPSNPIENYLQARTLTIDSAAAATKLRVVTTGHGFNCNPDPNVAEFSELTDTLYVNGTALLQHLWRDDCGINPLYPQPMSGSAISTWYYNRANWCPGAWVRPHDYDITTLAPAGTTAVIDYNMVPYTNTGGPSCSYAPEYWIQSHLVYYRNPSYQNNVELMAITQPNNAFEYRRLNPVCTGENPNLVIKNNGVDTLTSLTFETKMDGIVLPNFIWNGNLAFLDTAHVTLPPITISTGAHTFEAVATLPNGQADEFNFDNLQKSNFSSTNVYTTNVVRLIVLTDNTGNESSCVLKDDNNTIIFSRGYTSNNVVHRDTFYLPNGCYSFTMLDSFGDGMCCFNGTGFFRLLPGLTGISSFVNTGDFGASKTVNFTLNAPNATIEEETENKFSVFPNPSKGVFYINFNSAVTKQFSIDVLNLLGTKIYSMFVQQPETNVIELDLSAFPAGIYTVRMGNQKSMVSKRIVNTK